LTTPAPTNEGGRLGDGGVKAALEELERRRATCIARFETEDGSGEVEFLSGTIVDARVDELSGRGALFRLLEIFEGTFEVSHEPVAPRPALTPSLERVVGELAQWHKLSEQAPALSSVPELAPSGREALDRQSLAEEQRALLELVDGTRALAEIIDESGVDAVDALTLLVGAIQGGLIVTHAPQASLYPLKGEFGVVAPIVSISGSAPLSSRPPSPDSPDSPPRAHIPVTRQTLITGTPIASSAPPPGVHRIISIDSPPPPGPDAPLAPRRSTTLFGTGSVIDGEGPSTVRFNQTAADSRQLDVVPRRPSPAPPSVGEAGPPLEVTRVPDPADQSRYIGRYQILCRIGRGGMGSVYLCRLSSQGGFRRLFALKLLRKHLLADSASAQRFLDEARLAGHIHHHNVVSVIDAGVHASQPYLVMDYVEGGSLKDLLGSHSVLRSPQLVVSVVLDALAGLHAAHTLVGDDGAPLDIVHCDVSPENLLVGIDGVCRLTDFGVARQGPDRRDPRQVTHGKPAYLAPEQILGGRVDSRADVFAMGAILYRALTGIKLFEAATVELTLQMVCKQRIEPPSTVGLKPPPCFDFVCMRALERDPDRRFSSAQEMMMELRRIALRENLLAPTSEVAAWVRESVGRDLTRRRLIVLEASQRSRPMAVQSPLLPRPSSAPPADGREHSEAPPSSSLPPPNSSQESRTIALDPSQVAAARGLTTSARWALILASVAAVLAVLVTALWPNLFSKLFSIPTEAVVDDGTSYPADSLSVSKPSGAVHAPKPALSAESTSSP
jgi:serine/threonine-protein kinase